MPPAPRPTKLKKLVIDEISDVEFGANQHAHTSIIKSETGGSSVNITDILKALAGLSEADRAEVAKAVAVQKSDPLADLPAEHPIRKQIADAETKAASLAKRLDEVVEERAVAKAVVTAGQFAHIAKADTLAPLLRRIEKAADAAGDAKLYADALALFAAIEPAMAKAERSLGTMSGSPASEDATPLAKAVADYQKAHPGVNAFAAADAVLRANPSLQTV